MRQRSQITRQAQAKESQTDNQGQMIRLTGLWERAGILSGGLSPSAKLVILPNRHKKSSSDPDAIAYLQAPASQESKQEAKPAEAEQPSFWWDKWD